MGVRIIIVAVLASLTVLAMIGAVLFFLPHFTDDQEGVTARRTDRGAHGEDRSPTSDAPRAESTPELEQVVRLVGILSSPRVVRLDDPGKTAQLTVQGYYSDRSVSGLENGSSAPISFSSSDPSVADVDNQGVVTGIKTGGADITVSYDGLTATVPVFVWGPVQAVPPVDPEKVLEVSDDGSAVVLNRIMMELEPGSDASDADEVAEQIGGQVVFAFRTFPGYLVEFNGRSEQELEQALTILDADPRVVTAYSDLLLAPNDGGAEEVLPIETRLLPSARQGAYLDARMPAAWNAMNNTVALSPVAIAMDDTGFLAQIENPQVDAVLRLEFDDDRIQSRQGMGNGDHGNEVAGIMVARNNDRSDEGIPDESFSGVVTSVAGLEYDLLVYADNGLSSLVAALEDMTRFKSQIDVANISFGFSYCKAGWWEKWRCGGSKSHVVKLIRDMPGVTFVFAAGNSAVDAGASFLIEASRQVPNAIVVGATAGRGARWSASNFGPAITLGAPGSAVWTVDTDSATGYALLQGTSYAAPFVSGTVALLKALEPGLTPDEIKRILVETGQIHTVCTVNLQDGGPCPPENQERWSILDAGEAVSAVLWPGVDAEIDADAASPRDATLGDYVELTIPILNTGDRAWEFHLDGLLFAPSGATEELAPVRWVIPAGQSHRFKLGFPVDEVGEWTVSVKIYRDAELTSVSDSEFLRIQVKAGTGSAAVTPAIPAEPEKQAPASLVNDAFISVSAGSFHSCGIRKDKSVVCWGATDPPLSGKFASVDVGGAHTCGVKHDGTVACWGYDFDGQATPPDGRFISVSAGTNFSCGVSQEYTVACWGRNDEGQATPPPGEFTSVSAGGKHACGIRKNGTLACWGLNDYDQATSPPGEFVSVSAGWVHNCGLRKNGLLACWGYDKFGQAAPPVNEFIAVSAGSFHSCGLRTKGSVICWGYNKFGQATPPAGEFTAISAGGAYLDGWDSVSCGIRNNGAAVCWGGNKYGAATPAAGEFSSVSVAGVGQGYVGHTCALRSDGTVACWGENEYGQSTPPATAFEAVDAGADSYSLDSHTCGVKIGGSVACWGSNDHGQSSPPTGSFTSVSSGDRHTCGVKTDGAVACWGANGEGQAAPPDGSFASVSSGGRHTCGVKTDGAVACWGANGEGQAAPPDRSFASVSSGDKHTCGVKTDGTVACWGSNHEGQASPPAGDFASVSSGDKHTCGVKTDGTVACWGSDHEGQAMPPPGEFIFVDAGRSHNCGVQKDRSIVCWGSQTATIPAR